MANTSLNLTNLTNYVNELNFDIVSEAIQRSTLINRIPNMGNIPATGEYVNGIDTDLKFQSIACSDTYITSTSSVAPFRNLLTVTKIGTQYTICSDDINNTFYGVQARKLSGGEEEISRPFAEVLTADMSNKIPNLLEQELLVGSSTGTFSSSTSKLINGVLHKFILTSASASCVNVGLTQTYNTTNSINIIDQMIISVITNTPELVDKQDLELWISDADFDIAILALRNIDWFAYDVWLQMKTDRVIKWPSGTNVNVVAMPGLKPTNGKHYFILSYASNWRFGYDKYDPRDYEFFYDFPTRKYFYRWGGKYGIQNAFDKYVHIGVTN